MERVRGGVSDDGGSAALPQGIARSFRGNRLRRLRSSPTNAEHRTSAREPAGRAVATFSAGKCFDCGRHAKTMDP